MRKPTLGRTLGNATVVSVADSWALPNKALQYRYNLRCANGHEFQLSRNSIVTGQGRCPACYPDCTHPRVADHPLYRQLANIRARCKNPNRDSYEGYGARGVVVCARWLDPAEGFRNFLVDMGPRPSAAHTVDRRDNDGPYSPENCRWATPKEQARNRRTTHKIVVDGVTRLYTEWLAHLGIRVKTAWQQRRQSGESHEAYIKARVGRSNLA